MKEWVIENTSVTEEQYDEVMQYRESQEGTKTIIEPKKHIIANIQAFTLNKPSIGNRLLYQIKKDGNVYKYKDIKFKLFSDFYQDEDLFSTRRYGRCHEYSFLIASTLSELDIVTAICVNIKGMKFLHTFLLKKDKDNKEIVLDYTLNLVMSKEIYFDLMDVRVVSTLTNKALKEYSNYLSRRTYIYGKNLDIAEFLCFPEQLNEAVVRLERTKK